MTKTRSHERHFRRYSRRLFWPFSVFGQNISWPLDVIEYASISNHCDIISALCSSLESFALKNAEKIACVNRTSEKHHVLSDKKAHCKKWTLPWNSFSDLIWWSCWQISSIMHRTICGVPHGTISGPLCPRLKSFIIYLKCGFWGVVVRQGLS